VTCHGRRRILERGISTGVVLMVLFIIFVIAGALTGMSVSHLGAVSQQTRDNQAYYAAQAGVAAAENQLLAAPSYNGVLIAATPSPSPLPGNNGYCAVTVFPAGTTVQAGGQNVIVPTGVSFILATGYDATQKTQRQIGAMVTSQSIPNYAVYGINSLTFDGNAVVDSFNSDNGAYGGGNVITSPNGVTVATNGSQSGAITLHGANNTIDANVELGAGGNVSTGVSGSGVAGTVTVQTSNPTFPVPDPPTPSPLSGPTQGAISSSGSYGPGIYDSLSLSGKSSVTLSAGTYYFPNGISMAGQAQINVSSGPVKIYVGSSMDAEGNGFVNTTNVPLNLQIFGTSTLSTVKLAGNAQSYLTLYAPTADVTTVGNGNILGAVLGLTVESKGNGAIHYDQALLKANKPPVPVVVNFMRF
jgi:Tfp pilus assembly protein PilX